MVINFNTQIKLGFLFFFNKNKLEWFKYLVVVCVTVKVIIAGEL